MTEGVEPCLLSRFAIDLLSTKSSSYVRIMKNTIGDQGFVSEPGDGAFTNLGQSMGYVTQSADGRLGLFTAITASVTPRYEFWDHNGVQNIPVSPTYATMSINGQRDSYDGGMTTWNTSSSAFRPEALGKCYTLRITGKTAPTGGGGAGVIHIDFALSGANPPTYVANYNRQKQGVEFQSRNNVSHIDVQCIFPTFADAAMFASGAQIYMTTTIGGGIQLMSASIMIKEG